MKTNYDLIDPELRGAARMIRTLLRILTPAGLRRVDRFVRVLLQGKKPKDLHAEETWIPRRDGSQLRVMVYKPLSAGPALPAVLWLHGGGYELGLPEADVPTYRRMIASAPCVIVAPDYRLSFEHPYPAALDDCYDALLWLKQQAKEHGIRNDQIAVAGASAGGGLTAAVSLLARDRGEVQIAFQIPLYPMIDDRVKGQPTDSDVPLWDTAANKRGWQLYLGALYGGDNVPAYAAPARATDYSGLPPTCTFIGDFDLFYKETLKYVDNLKAAGVPVKFEVFRGGFHGFDGFRPDSEISKRALAFYLDWFKYAVENHFAPQDSLERN